MDPRNRTVKDKPTDKRIPVHMTQPDYRLVYLGIRIIKVKITLNNIIYGISKLFLIVS